MTVVRIAIKDSFNNPISGILEVFPEDFSLLEPAEATIFVNRPIPPMPISGSATFEVTPGKYIFSFKQTGTPHQWMFSATIPLSSDPVDLADIIAATPSGGGGNTNTDTGVFNTLAVNTSATLSPSGAVTISPVGVLTINPGSISSINNTSVGGAFPRSGRFTTLESTGQSLLNGLNVTNNAVVDGDLAIARTLSVGGVQSGTVSINPGTTGSINNVDIGNSNPAIGRFRILEAIEDTSLNNVSISSNAAITGNLIINGNLSVLGVSSTGTITTNSYADPVIDIGGGENNVNLTSNDGNDRGILATYFDTAERKAFFGRIDGSSYFTYYNTVVLSGENRINTASSVLGDIRAANFRGNLIGNSDSATKLQTPRAIAGVAFDGTANINLSTTNIAEGNNQYFTQARARAAISAGAGIEYSATTGVISVIGGTSGTGGTSGNATTATRLQTPRAIAGVPFDGSADIALTTTNITEGTNLYFTQARARAAISAGSGLTYNSSNGIITLAALGISNINGLQGALDAKANTGSVVALSGNQSIAGSKTFNSAITTPKIFFSELNTIPTRATSNGITGEFKVGTSGDEAYLALCVNTNTWVRAVLSTWSEDPPIATGDRYTTNAGVPLNISAPGVLSNDRDPEGGTLSATLETPPSNGTLTLNSNGSFIYTPNNGFSGSDSFTYRASDGVFSSPPTTVSITVNAAVTEFDFYDNFNDVASPMSGRSLPIASTSRSWEVASVGSTTDFMRIKGDGTAGGIVTGVDQMFAVFNAGATLLDVTTTVTGMGDETNRPRLIFNYVDTQNFWAFSSNPAANNTYNLFQVVNNVTNVVSLVGTNIVRANGDVWRLEISNGGDRVRTWINNTLVHDYTTPNRPLKSATRVGIGGRYVSNTSVSFGDFGLNVSNAVEEDNFIRTFHISPTGNDSTGNGSQASPWRTVTRAFQAAGPGDGIIALGGTYNLTSAAQITSNNGTSSAPITLKSAAGQRAIFDCSAVGNSSTNKLDGFIIARQWIVVKDIEIRGATKSGISIWGGKNIIIDNCTIHSCTENAIFMGHSTPFTVENCTVRNCTAYNNVRSNTSLQGGTTGDGGWNGAIAAVRCRNITFENNLVYQNYGEGLNLNQVQGGTITRNRVHDNFSVNIYVDQTNNFTVSRNFVYTNNNTSFYRFNRPAVGLGFVRELGNNPLSGGIVVNNIVIGGRFCFYFSRYTWSGTSNGGMEDFIVANNTFFSPNSSSQFVINLESDSGHSNNLFVNNIFRYIGGGTGIGSVPSNGFTFRRNNWFGGSIPANAGGTGDLTSDPLFVNPGANVAENYRVQAGSPTRGAGEVAISASVDFAGVIRTAPYDLGAYRY